MNQRIQELADEAAKFSAIMVLPTGEPGDKLFVKKFAELIVRECANIACEYDAPKMSGPGMIIAGRIETYFGVEE